MPNAHDPAARAREGVAAAQQGRHSQAVASLAAAAEHAPDNLEIRIWLAYSLEQLGRFHEALEQYQAAIELDPTDAELKAAAARAHVEMQKRPTVRTSGVPRGRDGRPMHGRTSPRLVLGILVGVGLVVCVVLFVVVRAALPSRRGPGSGETGFQPGVKLPIPTTAGSTTDPGAAAAAARESQLQAALYLLRGQIEMFYQERGRPPDSLAELATLFEDAGYQPAPGSGEEGDGGWALPVDPFTNSAGTWVYDRDAMTIHSGSDKVGLNGTPYSEW